MVTYVQGLFSADIRLHPPHICGLVQPYFLREAVLRQVQQ